MNNAIFSLNPPENDPIQNYQPGSEARRQILAELERQRNMVVEIPIIIGGKEVYTGNTKDVVIPHDHQRVVARYHQASEKEVKRAINEALKAKQQWENLSWIERSSILQKAAELIRGRYRYVLNAATMLGQSKNVYQAEIDAACETIDFIRYNSFFASRIYMEQPRSGDGQLNRMEYRALEGFVFTVTPFNFTAIASNLNLSVILMGNTTVWKPASTSMLSSYYLMKIFMEAGIPDGVINFVPGSGSMIGSRVLESPHLAGIHFTGSNSTLNSLWKEAAKHLDSYVSYPKIVGETGGKDFIFVHNSASPLEVATAIVRGAFEYQGQKCSAASRSYIPSSLWNEISTILKKMVAEIKIGGTEDLSNFMNAVIDESSFNNIMGYINEAKSSDECTILTGGNGDKSKGYFIEPTIIVTDNPSYRTMREEIFGPVMTIYVYDDKEYEETLKICDRTSPYALTGAIFSNDRYAMVQACKALRNAAGNFYINDKPTGAMVGLQPFGGARASGTNDKAGGSLNLLRWVSPRTIKETFVPATDFRYPYMEKE
jgi:1-pyrroline-5-carboxylate dehydrogenase